MAKTEHPTVTPIIPEILAVFECFILKYEIEDHQTFEDNFYMKEKKEIETIQKKLL